MANEKKGKKRKRRFRVPLFIIIPIGIILLTAVFFLFIAPGFNLFPEIRFFRNNKYAVSETTLIEIRKICLLNTIEYVYKIVFPYDFIPEGIDIEELIKKYTEGEPITEKEEDLVSLLTICLESGIFTGGNQYGFVVITNIIKAGYNFEGTVFQNIESSDEDIEEFVNADEEGTIFITLPMPEITQFIIEDSVSEEYAYPDLNITPENWEKLTTFIYDKIIIKVKEDGILDRADKNGKKFLEQLLLDSGWKKIVFNP